MFVYMIIQFLRDLFVENQHLNSLLEVRISIHSNIDKTMKIITGKG